MTRLSEIFAVRAVDRRTDDARRGFDDRRDNGRVRVPFERRRGVDRRQLVGRRDGEHRPHITAAELKVLLSR